MKKILLSISFLVCALISFSQAPQPRSQPTVTAVDARLRAGLNFGMPITQDTTLNGGLDSLGGLIYAKLYRSVFVRDTNTVGGGHLWSNLSFGATGIKNLNGLTGATQTFAIGTAGTNFNIVSTGTTHTFNIPIASSTNTGLLSAANFIIFTNKVNISDTAAMLAGYAQNIVLNLPTNTFSSPNIFTGAHTKTGTVTFNTQSNNTFLAGPASGGVGAVSWRLMVNGDLPVSPVTPGTYTNTTVTVNQQGIVTNIANGGPLGGQFYDSVTQVNDSTFTLDRPNGTHDTVQIKITLSPAISTLNNGLTLTGTNGQLGGALVKNTTILGSGFYTAFLGGRVELSQGVAVAASGNFTVGNDGNLFSVTGNTQINAITNTNWQAGSEIGLIFTGTPTLKNNTAGGAGTSPMLLAGSADYTAASGDYIGLRFDGNFWHETTRKLTGAGGVYVFSNGITEFPATRVKLGGTLTQNTTIAGAGTFFTAISGGRFETGAGASIVAANDLLLGSDGNQFSVTGNTQINALNITNWQAGAHIEMIFTGTPTLKNNTAGGVNTAKMLLAGSIDYTAAAGDLIGFSYDGVVWHETNRKLAGSVSPLSFNNGLTATGNLIQFGGTLIQTTTVTQGTNRMIWTGSDPSVVMSISSTSTGSALAINSTGDGVRSTTSTGGTAIFGSSSGIGLYGFSSGASGNGGFFQASGGSGGSAVLAQATAAGTFVYDGIYTDATTSTVVPVMRLIRNTLGTAGAGLGESIDLTAVTTNGNNFLTNQFISKWTDATTATRTSQFILTGVNSAAATTLITFNGNGQGIMTNALSSDALLRVSNTEPTNNNNAIQGISIVGGGVNGTSTSSNGISGQSSSGPGGSFTSTSGVGIAAVTNSGTNAAILTTSVPSTTNTVVEVGTFRRLTSGTAANGIGASISIQAQTTTSTVAGNTLISTLTDATGAAPISQFSIKGQNASIIATTLWTLDGNGNVTSTGGYIDNITNQAGGTYVIAANDLTVIFTGTTSTWTFPTAVKGRRLNLVNNGSGSITYGTAITTGNGSTTTTSTAGNKDQIQYDGTVWRKIN